MFLIVSILFIIFLCFLYFNIDKLRGKMNDSLHNYLLHVPKSLYKYKLPEHLIDDQKKFIKIYKSCIKEIPDQYKLMLQQCCKECSIIEEKNKIKSLLNLKFKCKMSTHNLENKFTFTINNWIVFNEITLKKFYLQWIKNLEINEFVKLMLHEKIHILQRNNQNHFNKKYLELYPYINKCIYIEKWPSLIKENHMLNPDTNLSLWIYKINGNIYYPYFCKKTYQELAYNPCEPYNKKEISVILKHNLRYGLHHPNETFAIQVSESLIEHKHKISQKLIECLQVLK